MAVVYQEGESFADLQNKYSPESQENDVGFFESALAGVATGLWNIPKGFVSLGAELFDLVGDTDTARDVENGLMMLIHLMMRLKLEQLEKLLKH